MSNQNKHTPGHSQAMEDFFDPKPPKALSVALANWLHHLLAGRAGEEPKG